MKWRSRFPISSAPNKADRCRISQQPAAIQLRCLPTLTDAAVEKNPTIVFPIPIEFVKGLADVRATHTKRE